MMHLSVRQRAAMAAEMANLEPGTNRYTAKVEGQNCSPKVEGQNGPSKNVTLAEAALIMNVSRRSVVTAKKRMRDDPKVHAEILAGCKVQKPLEQQYQNDRPEIATLSETAQQKFTRLVDKELKRLQALFEQEVREQARAQMPHELKVMQEATARAHNEFLKHAVTRKAIPAQMSGDDYRFLLNVLHPDRAPPDRREKFSRAFDIVRKLDEYIKAYES